MNFSLTRLYLCLHEKYQVQKLSKPHCIGEIHYLRDIPIAILERFPMNYCQIALATHRLHNLAMHRQVNAMMVMYAFDTANIAFHPAPFIGTKVSIFDVLFHKVLSDRY